MTEPLPFPSANSLAARPLSEIRALDPPACLLQGPPGSGKTHSLVTFPKAGIELFVLSTEPRGLETLVDAATMEGVDLAKIHWATIRARSGGIDSLQMLARLVNSSTYEALTKLPNGIDKSKSNQFMDVLNLIKDFKDEHTGQSYGDVTTWGPDRAFVIDSLSGLNDIIMSNTVGMKPAPAPGEWNVAQNQEMNLINLLTGSLRCYFVLIAHLDRVEDEVSRVSRVVPAAIGSKLGPKIGKYFSEVVNAKRVVAGPKVSYLWSTMEPTADLKNRALPAGDTLAPSFVPLVEAHRKRIERIQKPQ